MNDPFASRPGMYQKADEDTLLDVYTRLLRHIASRERQLHVFEEPVRAQRVLHEVRELFGSWPDRDTRPPLFGVPVGVKAIYATDGHDIHCGSLFPADFFARPQADLVSKLREAGAIVVGMTATSEFAHSEPAATRNPINPAHTPGGSSSGSAAGVAAGFFPVTLGTQTMGSVIRPAAFCGVPGFKPSQGRLSLQGIVPFAKSLDQPGFFCASVTDMPVILDILTSEDWRAIAQQSPCAKGKTFILGVPDGPYLDELPDYAAKIFAQSLRDLQESGGKERLVIRHVPCMEDYKDILRRHTTLAAAEAAGFHAQWFEEFRHLYRPGTRALIEQGMAVSKACREEIRASTAEFRAAMTNLMDQWELDAWIAPATLGEAPKGLASTGSPCMTTPWPHAGFPVMAIPYGTGPSGLPMALQIAGRWGADEALLDLGLIITRELAR